MVNVSPHYVIQFSEQLHMIAAQTQSRLSPWAKTISVTGEKAAYDSLGNVEAVPVSGQYQKIQFADIPHLRRKLVGKQYIIALPVDEKDIVQALIDPDAGYAKKAWDGMMRRWDKIIYDAALAPVYTGKDMDTLVTAANDGVATVNATAGLTQAKLDEINQTYIDNEVSIEENMAAMLAITGKEHSAILNEAKLTSSDYVGGTPRANGRMSNAAGLDLVLFGKNSSLPILDVVSTTRDCLSMAREAVVVGIWKDIDLKIQERPDLVTTHQIVITMNIGAVRTEGVKVQKVQTTV